MGDVKINFLGYNENTTVKEVREDFLNSENDTALKNQLNEKIGTFRTRGQSGIFDAIIFIILGRDKLNIYCSLINKDKTSIDQNIMSNTVGLDDNKHRNNDENDIFKGWVKEEITEDLTLGDVYNKLDNGTWNGWGKGLTDNDKKEAKSINKKKNLLEIFRNSPAPSDTEQIQDTEENEDINIEDENINIENEATNTEDENIDIENDIRFSKNIILYGPPGTGKTYNTAIYAAAICDKDSTLEEKSELDYYDIMEEYNSLKDNDDRIVFTTFHQSYSYEEFIEGIRPIMNSDDKSDKDNLKADSAGGELKYRIEDGIFKKFCNKAIENPNKNYVFIIDEINRGNISKIFGELITLIEENKRKGMLEAASATLPYSHDSFSVPSNVYIIGTMNTADRSIALMDTALRRRFSFEEMMPDSSLLANIEIESLNIEEMLETINNRIEFLFDREHTIGHAFFMKLKENPSMDKLSDIFKNSVIPLLQEYFYEDYEKIRLVLGDTGKKEKYQFIKREEIKPNNLFIGSTDLDFDKEYKYTINKEAFSEINSYIGIYKKIETSNNDTEQIENENVNSADENAEE